MKADFIERFTSAGFGRHDWVAQAWAAMKAKGATFGRLSHPPDQPDDLWLEGWLKQPDDQGPEPWKGST